MLAVGAVLGRTKEESVYFCVGFTLVVSPSISIEVGTE